MARMQISLARLKRDDIELVRQWRNDQRIVQRMEFRQHITPEMQERWFGSINNDRNYFFIASIDTHKCALLNLKDVNRSAGTAESGIFFDPDQELVGIPAFATAIALTDFAFGTLGLESLHARILTDNARAIRHTLGLGYQLAPNQDDIHNQLYRLVPRQYHAAISRIRRLVDERCAIIMAES